MDQGRDQYLKRWSFDASEAGPIPGLSWQRRDPRIFREQSIDSKSSISS